ncbi:hypothetical protein AAVH_06293 [Aphelenchoides avenae]|nr:hypothetical protein AAVH_06293 [Aphelenchus avenae]
MAACMIVVSMGLRLGAFGTFVATILSCSTLVHPLTTCFFIKPYRLAVYECFGWAPTNLITVTSTGGEGES